MGERLSSDYQSGQPSQDVPLQVGRVTLLEALAENTEAVGVSRSNHTTQKVDYDDQ